MSSTTPPKVSELKKIYERASTSPARPNQEPLVVDQTNTMPQNENKRPKRTLVVPAVAIGNVGQIAVDLLCRIVTKPVETLDSQGLLMPCAGNVGNKSTNRRLSTALELHTLNDDVSFLHINSMVVPGRSRLFAKYVVGVAKERGFDSILVVGASSALALINDDQLSKTRHLPRVYNCDSGLEGFVPLEYEVSELKLAGLLPFLVQESKNSDVQVSAIISFVFEGENWSDGVELAKATMRLLDLQAPE